MIVMKSRVLILIAAASALLGIGAAHAQNGVSALQGHDSKAPIDLAADRAEAQDRADRAIFAGNVVVKQGELTLRTARLISSEETLFLLSHLRMGVHLGRVKDIDLRTINELFLLTQPSHLAKLIGRKLEGDQRRAARAEFIRQRLNVN